ncbi:MAG TPA: ABC transporter permease [Tenuifilaceae bacterium]|nr:ABC transporter permease [Tenuifilaceae bacterium]
MLQLKRFFKTIIKYKTSTYLTLLSLVVSFVGIIILALYVSFERSFDQFNKNGKNIYRLESLQYGSALPATLTSLIVEQIPELKNIVTLKNWRLEVSTKEQRNGNINFLADAFFADSSFFDIFSFPLISGNKSSALVEPYSVVVTRLFANKIFGTDDVLGRSVVIMNEDYRITGVMEDLPKNSSIQGDCFVSLSTLRSRNMFGINEWEEWSFVHFLQLNPNANSVEVAHKIEQIPKVTEVIQDMKARYPGKDFILLRPLYDIHYVSDWYSDSVNPLVLNVLTLLAIILAIMGGVNFINFSTSQAPLRTKSFAILRVLGGSRFSARTQVIIESVLLSVVAMGISLIFYSVSYPTIETIFNINGLSISGRYVFIVYFFLLAIVFGVVVGIYPAYYITSTTIVQAVKGRVRFEGKAKSFRNILITIQFVFTIALLAAAITINKQLAFWRNFDLGINKQNVVYVRLNDKLKDKYNEIADELMKNPSIVDYTYSSFIPGAVGMGWGREVDGQYIQLKSWPVDDKFIDFFNVKILEGRKFQKNSQADINTFIINKKAAEKFGWNHPLEKSISGFDFQGKVIGVADNIKFASLKDEVEPMLFWFTNTRNYVLMLRINPGNFTQLEKFIKSTINRFDPQIQVEVKFLDDYLNTLYDKEQRVGYFIEAIGLWCMVLAITGLLGLVIFICRDRIKEIGVRKVNGATTGEVIFLINRSFLIWVLIAFVIAVPVTYYAMEKWLESFAYRTSLTWWIFALSGMIALMVELVTVSWLSWRAASSNPVEALRYE